MDEFEPMRDFYQPRQAITFDRLAQGLQIQIEDSRVVLDNFFFPGLTFTANILRDGQHAGTVRYGQSPLQDRLYICDFKVRPELRKTGVGQAALWRLWCLYQVPLSPAFGSTAYVTRPLACTDLACCLHQGRCPIMA